MKIKELNIKNWKSIYDFSLKNPNPFTVFAGPNASGKSNIFEAIEFLISANKISPSEAYKNFGALEDIFPSKQLEISEGAIFFELDFDSFVSSLTVYIRREDSKYLSGGWGIANLGDYYKDVLLKSKTNSANDSERDFAEKTLKNIESKEFHQFFSYATHLFIRNKKVVRQNIVDNKKLNNDASNMESILRQILLDEKRREEILEWLQLLIPGFENIEIRSQELSGNEYLVLYEKNSKKPFGSNLISDGTYNILCLLTAIFQFDEPQFLMIEEPENGLNPKVVEQLVELIRSQCQEKGHYIWLNTHSQTLVNKLEEKELIFVHKKEGETKIKQFKKGDAYGLPLGEAWLTNVITDGLPW